jgi:RNA polymerase sigma-70 factor (ECF subfamily)
VVTSLAILGAPRTASAYRMDEDRFRAFYDHTARPLKAYLYRMTGDAACADDLLQESYLRLLQSKAAGEISEEHRKNYLFRIATNLSRNHASRRKTAALEQADASLISHSEVDVARRADMERLLIQLQPRQRELLWLAYVEGMNHFEIARIVGVKTASVRPLLARARSHLGEILRTAGFTSAIKEKQ